MSNARAAGVEETVGGTVALGRAAHYARVNDFMAVWQNPANLALAGRHAGVDLRIPIFNGCFNRNRNDTTEDLDRNGMPGIQYKAQESFDKVCNEAAPFPYGNAGVVVPLWKSLTLGGGLYTPSGIVKHKYGDDRVITQAAADPSATTTGTESANRYLLVDRTVLAAWVMAGLGYEPIERLRVGATFGWGFADINYKNVSSVSPGFTDIEVVNEVHATDAFIPRIVLSAAATPIDALDVMLSFTWTDDVSADGRVELSANGIENAPLNNCRDARPGPRCRIDDITLKTPYQRFELVGGVRYASRRVDRTRTIDPLKDERWDAELNLFYSNTGHVKDYELELYEQGDPNPPGLSFSSSPTAPVLPLPNNRAVIPHRWRDTWGFRVGGDYVFLPEQLAGRIGLSYESSAVNTSYMNIDYWPVWRVGLHMGLTARVRMIDLHVAYAHLFNQTMNVPLGSGRVNEVSAIPTTFPLGVNEGRYTSRVDIVSLQGNYRF